MRENQKRGVSMCCDITVVFDVESKDQFDLLSCTKATAKSQVTIEAENTNQKDLIDK